jgi:hypothetical protein
VVVIGGDVYDGADLSDRKWIKINGLRFVDTKHYWIEFDPNGSHNYISNNEFEAFDATMGYEGLHLRNRADYNKIINNTFTSECRPLDLIQIWNSSYNLVDGNYLGYAAHTALSLQSRGETEYNIIRNNTIQNRYHNNLGVFDGANYTLVEKNTILDSGADCDADSCQQNKCGSERDQSSDRTRHSAIQVGSQNCIIRNNVLSNNGRFTLESFEAKKYSVDNSVYHNTFYANYIGWRTTTSGENPLVGNLVKNNIFADQIDINLTFTANLLTSDNHYLSNAFSGSAPVTYKAATGLSQIQSKYPEWQGNLPYNPSFKNAKARNFNLRSDSKLIDSGDWLTVITSSNGSGNTFTVEDARFFSDGFGIIDGDQVQIQNQSATLKIVSIDYNSNKIVVNRSVSWKKGDGLSLPYSGNSPDIGAFEFLDSSALIVENDDQPVPGVLNPPTLTIISN